MCQPGLILKHDLRLLVSCSGRPHRLAYLPLGPSHPEEDRAGQGVLTAPPAAGLPVVQHRDRTRRGKPPRGGLRERQGGFKSAHLLIPLPLFHCGQTLEKNFWAFLRFSLQMSNSMPTGTEKESEFLFCLV